MRASRPTAGLFVPWTQAGAAARSIGSKTMVFSPSSARPMARTHGFRSRILFVSLADRSCKRPRKSAGAFARWSAVKRRRPGFGPFIPAVSGRYRRVINRSFFDAPRNGYELMAPRLESRCLIVDKVHPHRRLCGSVPHADRTCCANITDLLCSSQETRS